jgi:hypothetical protein
MAIGRKTGGRVAGTPNRATADIKALAQEYTPEAIKALAKLAGLVDDVPPAESEQARVAAIKELLDRGHGKSIHSVDATVTQTDPAAEARSKEIMHRLIARFDEVVAIRRAEARAAGLIVDVMPGTQRITNGCGNGAKKPKGQFEG